jgi:transposase
MSTTRRYFPEVFKREAVDRVISSGLPVGKVATELGLNETVLRRWVTRLGGQATGPARRPITQAPVASPSDLAAENARRENERLRMERDILKKPRHLRSGLPMKFGFVDEHRHLWPVRAMCAALCLSVSGYYAWRSRVESPRAAQDAWVGGTHDGAGKSDGHELLTYWTVAITQEIARDWTWDGLAPRLCPTRTRAPLMQHYR